MGREGPRATRGRGGLRAILTVALAMLLPALLAMLFLLLAGAAHGQDAGRAGFFFLDLPVSPRHAGLGGKVPMLLDAPDATLGVYNPACAGPELQGAATLGVSLFYGGVRYNTASYHHGLGDWGLLGGALRQVWYGRMVARDAEGNPTGRFAAHDQALSLLYTVPLGGGWRIGAAFTPLLSTIERYVSVGLTADVGASFLSASGEISVGILCRNVGGTLRGFTRTDATAAPFELLAGVGIGLGYAPVRITLVMQQLQNWRLRVSTADQRNRVEGNGLWYENRERTWPRLYRELFAHMIAGVEVHPIRYLHVQLGYNHARRDELSVGARTYLEGFSWGIGARYKRLRVLFARSLYHLRGGANHILVQYHFGPPPGRTAPAGGSVDVESESAVSL